MRTPQIYRTLEREAFDCKAHRDTRDHVPPVCNLTIQSADFYVFRIGNPNLNKQLHSLITSAMDAVICIDSEHNITLFNASAETMFGMTQDDALGRPLNRLIPERFHEAHSAHVNGFGRTGSSSRRMGPQNALVGLRSNGEEFPVEASISRASSETGLVYSVILRDITERKRAGDALIAAKQELQMLSRGAIRQREDERTRVARELHDELGQKLTALKMDLKHLEGTAGQMSLKQSEALQRMKSLLDETVANTRRIASNLRPLMLDDLGLSAALEWQVQQFLQRHPMEHVLDLDPQIDQLPAETASHIFRIVQEALNNIAKHAFASEVRISVRVAENRVSVEVIDNGKGIPQENFAAKGSAAKGLGLLGIRERAHSQAGTLDLQSRPGEGVAMRVQLEMISKGN